jgi:peroxiredoxin
MFPRNTQRYTCGVMLTREVRGMARAILWIVLMLVPVVSQAGEVVVVGQEAPPFSLPDLFGKTISLDYFDGNPGLIVFWSVTSPRSIELLKDVREYHAKWGREDLAIVAVNADGRQPVASEPKTIRQYAEHLELMFPVLLDSGQGTLAAYGVSDAPMAVVVDAGGRISSVVRGYTPTLRDELKGSLLQAMGEKSRGAALVAAAGRGGQEGTPRAAAEIAATSCSIPRARSCTRLNERDPAVSDPSVMAVRLCVCHGDVEAAQIMLSGVDQQSLLGLDLRFALAHMLLLKGRTTDARRAFETLNKRYPQEGWGEWGLGIVALTEGDAEGALGHILAARARGLSIPEVETAVLKYLEGYWRSNRPAPREEQFLALFEELDSVRACYKRLNQRG